MATYEVSLVVEGTESEVETHRNEGAAYAAADRLAEIARNRGDITWNVYVTPLVAAYAEDEDEVHIPYMPDHRPYRSG
jgi:hypothetical protein